MTLRSWRPSRVALLLTGCAFLYAWFIHFWPTFHAANESIRLYFVQAVVDHGSAEVDPVIERYGMRNIDRAEYGGHTYLDKAPGLSLVVIPAYAVLTGAFNMSTDFVDLPRLYYLLLLLGVVIPALLGIYWTYRLTLDWTGNVEAALAASTILAVATPYALYATLFFGHTPAAAAAIGALWFAGRRDPSTNRFAIAGALGGFAVLLDTAVAPLIMAIAIATVWRTREPRDLVTFVIGGLPFAIVQLGYNTLLFDDPFTFAYAHKATSEFADIHSQGVYGMGLPTWEAMFGLLFSPQRGLFTHAPVLLLGVLVSRKDRNSLMLTGLTLLYFVWISGFGDWRAGSSYGPRHLIPIMPLLAVGVGLSLHRFWEHARSRLGLAEVAAALAVVSVAATWLMIATFPYAPEAFDVPVLQLALPMALDHHFSPNLGRSVGLSEAASVVPVLLALLGFGLLVRRWWIGMLLGVLATLTIIALGPPASKDAITQRCLIECLVDHPERGKSLCAEHGGRWSDRACHCRLPQ
ncbi:MAG: hypothetical protein ACI9OJ_005711 [Myxococcota bacterium]|jgi:hypothetical protein